MKTSHLFVLFVLATLCVYVEMSLVTRHSMRRWVVKLKPEMITRDTDFDFLASDVGKKYRLEGSKIGALYGWILLYEKEGSQPLSQKEVKHLKAGNEFKEVRLEVGRNRVLKEN